MISAKSFNMIIAATLIVGTTVASADTTAYGDKIKKFIEKQKSDQKCVRDIIKKFRDRESGGR